MRVALFVTCLCDQFFPQVGEATVALLRRLGLRVEFPQGQTCCGQVAFNAGFFHDARQVARRLLQALDGYDYVVAPSGSCVSMIRAFYPRLFAGESPLLARAQELASCTYELSQFLVRILGVEEVGASFRGRIAYHPSCHLRRELGEDEAPRRLIRAVRGAELVGLEGEDICCGFGGLFSLCYPHLSNALLQDKIRAIRGSGADAVVSCDAGCLLHIAGGLSRRRVPIRALHLAELLASREG